MIRFIKNNSSIIVNVELDTSFSEEQAQQIIDQITVNIIGANDVKVIVDCRDVNSKLTYWSRIRLLQYLQGKNQSRNMKCILLLREWKMHTEFWLYRGLENTIGVFCCDNLREAKFLVG